jgi:hypothetical protein
MNNNPIIPMTLQDFVYLQDKCIFCQSPLKIELTNGLQVDSIRLPDICAPLKNNQFTFKLKYDGERLHFDVGVCINLINNKFSFFYYGLDIATHKEVADALMSLSPQIELLCQNKECHSNYCLRSKSLEIDGNANLKLTCLAMEMFSLSHWQVCNYYPPIYGLDSTLIFSIESYLYDRYTNFSNAIKCDRIDFESMPPEKLVNRLRTIVTFS